MLPAGIIQGTPTPSWERVQTGYSKKGEGIIKKKGVPKGAVGCRFNRGVWGGGVVASWPRPGADSCKLYFLKEEFH